MVLDTILKVILIVSVTVFTGVAIYTLIASEIRQRRLDKQYEDTMNRLREKVEREHE